MKLGELIRKLRDQRGWSQGQLALYSDLNKAHISMMERGLRDNPTMDTVAKIARALQISVDDMLIEIGLLPQRQRTNTLSPAEQRFLHIVRSIPTPSVREKVFEQLSWVAEVAKNADFARLPEETRQLADESADYESNPEEPEWSPALLRIKEALELYPAGSAERDAIERVVIAQAEAYIHFRGEDEED